MENSTWTRALTSSPKRHGEEDLPPSQRHFLLPMQKQQSNNTSTNIKMSVSVQETFGAFGPTTLVASYFDYLSTMVSLSSYHSWSHKSSCSYISLAALAYPSLIYFRLRLSKSPIQLMPKPKSRLRSGWWRSSPRGCSTQIFFPTRRRRASTWAKSWFDGLATCWMARSSCSANTSRSCLNSAAFPISSVNSLNNSRVPGSHSAMRLWTLSIFKHDATQLIAAEVFVLFSPAQDSSMALEVEGMFNLWFLTILVITGTVD